MSSVNFGMLIGASASHLSLVSLRPDNISDLVLRVLRTFLFGFVLVESGLRNLSLFQGYIILCPFCSVDQHVCVFNPLRIPFI